jgi:hypothetical protein
MGHYTRMKFDAVLSGDTPQPVIDLLLGATRYSWPSPESLPAHPLFGKGHWKEVLRGNATSKWPEADGELRIDVNDDGSLRLAFHTSLKNYDDEIHAFCDWIAPYLVDEPGTVVGEFESDSWEWDALPTLLIAQRGSIDQVLQKQLAVQDRPGGFGFC